MTSISFTYLSGPDIAALEMTDDEILIAVERGLTAQGLGESVIEPRVHLEPDPAFRGHVNVLRAHVEAGKLSERTLHGELCEIVTGAKPGRERDDETILFWHRGLSLSDIALGAAMLEKAAARGLGQILPYA